MTTRCHLLSIVVDQLKVNLLHIDFNQWFTNCYIALYLLPIFFQYFANLKKKKKNE